MKRLEWRAAAIDDRRAIVDYIADDNPAAAIDLDVAFHDHALRACKEPTLYRPGRVKGTREIVVRPSYVMVYRVAGAVVEIVRVLHAAQQWPPRRR